MQHNFINPQEITLDNYADTVSRFCSRLPLTQHNAHMALGLADEYFELEKAYKNNDTVNIIEEAGDLFWYLGILCWANRRSFAKIVHMGNDVDMFPEGSIEGVINWAKAKLAGYTKVFTDEQVTNFMASAAAYILSRCPDNVTIEEILRRNYLKLANRHGASFNPDNGQSRNVEVEREILAGDTVE